MRLGIDGVAAGEEEVGPRGTGNSGLDPANGLSNGAELESANAGGGEERSEDHVVARGDANDIVELSINSLHQTASSPSRSEHNDSRLLAAGFSGGETTESGRRRARRVSRGGEGGGNGENGRQRAGKMGGGAG